MEDVQYLYKKRGQNDGNTLCLNTNVVFRPHENKEASEAEDHSFLLPVVTLHFLVLTAKYSCMTIETEAVKSVAGLMALSARTAPKAVGIDSIKTELLTGKDQDALANQMIRQGKAKNIGFFRINGEQVKISDATLLIGVEGHVPPGINCGGCGHATCAEMVKAVKTGKNKTALYPGPNCVLKISDLGIAVGSAVKTAKS